jgi:transposase-like protein
VQLAQTELGAMQQRRDGLYTNISFDAQQAVVASLQEQFDSLPSQHWQSIRTSNPIESTFATIRHRTKRGKGCLSRDGMLHMMFKIA